MGAKLILSALLSAVAAHGQATFSLQDQALLSRTAPLLTGLTAYLKLEESAGNRIDFGRYGNDFVPRNGASQTSGKVGNCISLASASSHYLDCASNSSLTTSNLSYELTFWMNATTVTGSGYPGVVTKGNTGGNSLEYAVFLELSTSKLGWQVGSTSMYVYWGSALSASTWYFVDAYRDVPNNQVGISINNGTFVTSTPAAVTNRSAAMIIGAWADASTATDYFNGKIDELGFWRRLLTTEERARLYNAGSGVSAPRFK